ncbi:helix-turn-helix domain-containing protein [Eggerthella lenta]|uniref:helix-turn-helix domain-containing protein n=1 Tax=Eggerthella lenta TaxID=84112 RepID=UPI000DF7673F|nr:helix-turn-helix transcriptional regulator [Eggerthella lenta]MDB1758713.1 helix-turn-helix transcriptional regulator [Eggerthella lenta]MDB1765253.1 helix-turn-helix transcriptional regulator [Eggerthella lenta]MDB1805367.1 helix-turn-helix transcriptional regulator [Eggerthella lenta]RDC05127.1 XRE family transcriptional regulator [Eggerthella lenta]
MDFGEKLKALRTERGLTQEQLAARLYVSRTAVSKWETGGGSPNLDSLQAVARLFDVSVDDLLSADDLIVLARDERRSTARSSGMLSFGLLDVLAVVFAFIPLYGVDDGSFVRMANLADYGASVDFGASFAVMAAAVVSLMFVGAVEIVLAAAGSRRAARIVALVGFAVQALAVVLFASTMQPYATTLMFALLLAKVVVGYRILRS